jgi:hypothetical protein
MEFNLINANQELVFEVLDRLIKERYPQACSCTLCMNDSAALALNSLAPHYYVSGLYKATGSPVIMVEAAVAQAIEKIQENPRHERGSHVPHVGAGRGR